MSKRKASSDAPQRSAKRAVVENGGDSSDDSDSVIDQSQRPDFQTNLVGTIMILSVWTVRSGQSDQDLHYLRFCLHLLDAFELPHAKTNKMIAQRRLRSAWASAKSDQSSLCAQ